MWHVLLAEPNRERTATKQLELFGCEPYLPTFTARLCYQVRGIFGAGRRWRIVERPLFPGYLFLPVAKLEIFSRFRLAATGIRQKSSPFLRINGYLAAVDDEKINDIKMLENSVRNSVNFKFSVGQRVRITDGPFAELVGVVHMLSDEDRIILLLDLLGQSSKVRVAAHQIEAVAA